ncbi:phosphate ABC transporter permease PstA [Myxococcota bacterium]|nr:phosphate ABC transporter permease PstA [Myxococcota bacterium]MBU1410863.1 phosphate ABC transporter permease PstA [Myxococcota bacterium]MBU1509254.1 phosphate ABC transporter permease PstA [Myxococcota bacterium]
MAELRLPHRSPGARKAMDVFIRFFSVTSATIGIFFLCWILWVVLKRGHSVLSLSFFTSAPPSPGEGTGGIYYALVGTLKMTGLACLMGVPLGLLTGVHLAEFGRHSWFAAAVRFCVNLLMGIPSILVGLFAYTVIVLSVPKHYSGYAGAFALAIIMLPTVARTTEDMLLLVPDTLRESTLALGIPRWRMITGILFRAARKGLLTGVLLSISRVSGETAPLLFTALNNNFYPKDLGRPTANLTVTIYNYAMSPYENWQRVAWGASLVIMAFLLGITVLLRTLLRERNQR